MLKENFTTLLRVEGVSMDPRVCLSANDTKTPPQSIQEVLIQRKRPAAPPRQPGLSHQNLFTFNELRDGL
jgi:hypothetical protein